MRYIDRYDFGGQLSRSKIRRAQVRRWVQANATAAQPQPTPGVPAGFKPKTDVQLTKTAQDAVQISEKWMAEHNSARGRSRWPGAVLLWRRAADGGLCAPSRVHDRAAIRREVGRRAPYRRLGPLESVAGDVRNGDFGNLSDRSEATRSGTRYKSPDYNRPPAYYLRLLSKPDDYVARVAFAYPDEEENEKKWQQHLAEQKDQRTKPRESPNSRRTPSTRCTSITGSRVAMTLRPVRVFDDGKKTYIQISQAARNREAPVLVVIGPDGKQEMVNYRVKDDMYIVDRLFERAELILGSGKKARKVEIDRERKG